MVVPAACAPLSAACPVAPVVVPSLLDALDGIKDFRSPQGRRHKLKSLLALLIVGFLSGCNTIKAIVAHARNNSRLRSLLGFTHPDGPAPSLFTRLFTKLKMDGVRQTLVSWLESLAISRVARRKAQASVDGKTLRGTGHHVLNVFIQDYWMLLDQMEVGEKKNEMSAFRAVLAQVLVRYPFLQILTFDAMFCEKETMAILTSEGRMGIFQVKENQPEAFFRMGRWFSPLPKDKPGHQEFDKSGDYITTRETWIANAPKDILEKFPHARQIVAVRSTSEPRRPEAKPRGTEVHFYVITGPPGLRRLPCKTAAKIIRGHWGIENRLHHVLDRTFREDEQKCRTGDGPLVLALMRGVSVTVLQNHLPPRLARLSKPLARQALAARPKLAARLVTHPLR